MTPTDIASLGLLAGIVQIAAIGLLSRSETVEYHSGGFTPPRTDKPHLRRRRDDEALLMLGAL